MARVLRQVSQLRPWQVLAAFLLLSIVTAPFQASDRHPALLAVGYLIGFSLLFGYPLLIILGFPEPYSTALRRRIALASFALIWIIVLALGLRVPQSFPELPEWARFVGGLPLVALLYAPFFVATSVIGDARRALGQYKPMDFIGTWICVFAYPVWGSFFIQRDVASVLTALDATHRSG